MVKKSKYLILFSIICCLLNVNVFAKDKSFFPDEIVAKMKSDLPKFLNEIPDELQRARVMRVLQNSEYKNILLFVNDPFSPKITSKLSQLKDPFMLIDTLDDLAYILKIGDCFSDWYFSKLLLLVNSNPDLYMTSFLRFCEKSKGVYAEWFSDPLTDLIEVHPKEFSTSLCKIKDRENLCAILLGDGYQVHDSIKVLSIYNEKHKNKCVSELIDCVNNPRED